MTVMLWILWSDTVRPRKSSRIVYSIRMVLFIGMIAALYYNFAAYPEAFNQTARVLLALATLVGLAGVVYFFMRARAAVKRV